MYKFLYKQLQKLLENYLGESVNDYGDILLFFKIQLDTKSSSSNNSKIIVFYVSNQLYKLCLFSLSLTEDNDFRPIRTINMVAFIY